MRLVVVCWCLSFLGAGCGSNPPSPGVAVNRARLIKTALEATPDELGRVRTRALVREKQADVMGDDRFETITPLPGGVGIEIRSEEGGRTVRIAAPAYLTDFGAAQSSRPLKQDVIMYVYPSDDDAGTFLLVNPEDGKELARWNEDPPPGRFAVGTWLGVPALFYTQRDSIVIKTPTGILLERLRSPGAGRFRDLYVAHPHQGGLVVVGSGNGYTPYHLVAVYDSSNELVFHEIGLEHAFALDIEDTRRDFVVTTRTGRWKYGPSGRTEGEDDVAHDSQPRPGI